MNTDERQSVLLRRPRLLACAEIALIFLLLFTFAGSPPPGDDEPYYLGKAKQFWNPDWLAGDFFLETPDAHVVFDCTIGWLTRFCSLTATAWIGRAAAWLLLAIAWRRLSWALLPRPLVSLLTMALFLVFQQYGTAAREWIVGDVEAKCFAYVFVILGLEQLVRGRWRLVWPLLGAAAAFHVLVGGWSVVAALLAWAATKDRPSFVRMAPWLAAGGLLSLAGVIPALRLNWNADPAIVREANMIYVFERLKHHLAVYEFPWQYKLRFLAVLAAWLGVCYLTRGDKSRLPLRRFVLGSIVIGVAGIVVDQATMFRPELAASLLRYYWYRLPDVMVPLGLAFALAEWAMPNRAVPERAKHDRWATVRLVVLILAPTIVLTWRFALRRADGRPTADVQGRIGEKDPREYADWLATCDWIEASTPPNARFLTPPGVTSFRWYAQRSEVVGWKDIPQNAEGIVEWDRRLERTRKWWRSVANEGLTAELREELLHMASAEEYDFQYVIVPRGYGGNRWPLVDVYPTDVESPAYTVYWIRFPTAPGFKARSRTQEPGTSRSVQ